MIDAELRIGLVGGDIPVQVKWSPVGIFCAAA